MSKITTYGFNIEDAVKYGTDGAILLYNIRFWVHHNKANQSPMHLNKDSEGQERYWTFNSKRAYSELFPFWTEKQLRRIIANLVAKGAIMAGNFNRKAYDKTKWYTLADDSSLAFFGSESLGPNGPMDRTEWANGSAQKGQPIPDITPDLNSHVSAPTPRQNEEANSFLNTEEPKKTVDPLVQGLDQTELESLATLKYLDDKDQSFLADIVGIPVVELTLKQANRLTRIRKKAANGRKIEKLRPMDPDEVAYAERQRLEVEVVVGEIVNLPDDKLLAEARYHGVTRGPNETMESVRQRVKTAVQYSYSR